MKYIFYICHLDKFYDILKEKKLIGKKVSGKHKPINDEFKCIWFSPNTFGSAGSFYGNIGFCLDFSKVWNGNFRYYFYENTKYGAHDVYRYIISKKNCTLKKSSIEQGDILDIIRKYLVYVKHLKRDDLQLCESKLCQFDFKEFEKLFDKLFEEFYGINL